MMMFTGKVNFSVTSFFKSVVIYLFLTLRASLGVWFLALGKSTLHGNPHCIKSCRHVFSSKPLVAEIVVWCQ